MVEAARIERLPDRRLSVSSKLRLRTGRPMLWRHILGYLPVNAVQGVVSVATIVVLTRLLDPDDYGRYALVLAAAQLVQMGCFTWLHASMARFYEAAERDGRLGAHFASCYAAYAGVAAIVTILYVGTIAAADFPPRLRAALLFGLLLLLLRALLMIGVETHRAARHVRVFGALETIQSVGGLALAVALILYTDLAESAPFLAAAVASAVCLIVDLPRIAAMAGRATPNLTELRRFAAYGIPVSVMLALHMVFGVADRFLIGWMLGEAEVGVYAAGYQVASRTMDIFFTWLGMAAMPLVVAAYEREGVEAARAIARRNAETLILVGFPAAAGLALVAEPLAAVMLGAEFRVPAAAIIPWIALSSLMLGLLSHYVHHAFVLAGRNDVMAALIAIPAVANIALNLVLIPRLGLQGAVISSVVAYALALSLCTVVGLRYFPLPIPGRALLRGAAATGVMATAVWLVPTTPNAVGLVAKMAVGVLSYVPAALLLDLAGSRRWLTAAGRRLMSVAPSGRR